METAPGNPSAAGFRCGIPTPHVTAGAPLLFPRHQRLSSPHGPAEGPLVFPIRRNYATLQGAVLCDLTYRILFHSGPEPLTAAIAPGIAILSPHGGAFLGPFQIRMGDGGHHSGCPAPSCRLCLIACNSRKFTCGYSRPSVPEEVFSGDR